MVTQQSFPDKWSCQSDNKEVIVEVRTADGPDVVDELSRSIDPQGTETEFAIGNGDALSELRFEIVDEATNEAHLSFPIDHPDVFFSEGRYRIVLDNDRLPDNPGIRVTDAQAYEWIEIPTTEVDVWITKGESAQIQRSAKVKFPTEWGTTPPGGAHNSPRQLLEEFDTAAGNPFMYGRVLLKDDADDWVLSHLGWIGGIGGEDSVFSKLWIYDFAEFLPGTPVGLTLNDPSIGEALREITELVQNETPIPLETYNIIPPETEEELATTLGPRLEGISEEFNRPEDPSLQYYTAREIDTQAGKLIPGEPDSKHFTANRDTLLDVFDWFEQKTHSSLHFDPMPDGTAVQLVADVTPSRRTFIQDAVNADGEVTEGHELAVVTENDALYEMKPFNTVHLRGASSRGFLGDVGAFFDETVEATEDAIFGKGGVLASGIYDPPPKKYPVVKVRVPSLVQAAEGVEVAGEVIESDAQTLDTAEREAQRALRKRLEEMTEGSIDLLGESHLMPFDKLVAYEVCGDYYQYEPDPVEYEVEEVHHTIAADDVYRTEAQVSVYANEEHMEIVRSEMVEVDES